jgi:integrase
VAQAVRVHSLLDARLLAVAGERSTHVAGVHWLADTARASWWCSPTPAAPSAARRRRSWPGSRRAKIPEEPPHPEDQETRSPVFVFRPVHRNGTTVAARGMSVAAINNAVQRACVRALVPDARSYSAHALRAGFATYASQRGASDRAIAHQTPPPVAGVARPVHQDGERVGGQRRHCAGPVKRR